MGRPKLHEMRWTKTYTSWVQMKARCSSPTHTNWKQYGARGIKVCERWFSFTDFFADMGERPEGTTLDRIENSKGYEPGNCRWATHAVQSRNRGVTVWIEFNGETMCMSDLAVRLGLNITTLCYRLKHWGAERALSEPLHKEKAHAVRT